MSIISIFPKHDEKFATDGTLTIGTDSVLGVALPTKSLTSAEYEALAEEEKQADVAYIITDDNAPTVVGGVASFNGRSGDVVPQAGDYTAAMVGALSADTEIPTVPEWAQQPEKPTYTAAEVGAATMEQVNAAIQAAVLDSWEGSY